MQRQWKSTDTDKWRERFGNGSDGDLVISSNTTFSTATSGCSGTSGTTSLTLSTASTFANGDLVLIIQTRGTRSDPNWELNKIASGGGGTSLTMAYDLTRNYVDSGSSQAQILKLSQYSSVTVNSGITWTAPAWDQSTGGIIAFLCNGDVTITGTISTVSKGYLGGAAGNSGDNSGYCGEGSGLASTINTADPDGSGGGKSGATSAGGGHATTKSFSSAIGTADGTASLTQFYLGAGGGGGSSGSAGNGAGGRGAGSVMIFGKTITVTGAITGTGDQGGSTVSQRAGSGGSGGACLFKGEDIVLGTTKVVFNYGPKGTGNEANSNNTDGSVGRIHADYSKSFSGTTTPTIDATQDATISVGSSSGFFMFLQG